MYIPYMSICPGSVYPTCPLVYVGGEDWGLWGMRAPQEGSRVKEMTYGTPHLNFIAKIARKVDCTSKIKRSPRELHI